MALLHYYEHNRTVIFEWRKIRPGKFVARIIRPRKIRIRKISPPENPSLLPPKLEGIDASTPNYIVLTVIIAKDTYLLIGNSTN